MTSSPRRVVLTGLGVVCPIGLDLATFGESLWAGRTGIRQLDHFDTSTLPVSIGANIPIFDARDYLEKKDRKSLKLMVRTIQLAVAASRLALDDAGLKPGDVDPLRFGVSFGTGTIPSELAEIGQACRTAYDPAIGQGDFRRWGKEGMSTIPPMWMLNHVPNMAACHVSILNNLQGPNNTHTQSDAAGLLAIGEAIRVLHRRAADLMLAGGSDTRTNAITLLRYSLFSHLSRCADPSQACRPFDRRRDGQVLGEGAGVLILEDREHALRRGATIRAEVLGFGAAFDKGLRGEGVARAVRAALHQANIGPEQLDHVNAHAGGCVEEDAWEARGLREAVGDVPVLAVKSYIGNLGPGAAGVELAASLVALDRGEVPATLNSTELDPRCPIEVIREPRPLRRDCFLKVACTERGQCAAIVLRRGP